jgi:hypothetical protein
MLCRMGLCAAVLICLGAMLFRAAQAVEPAEPKAVVVAQEAPFAERLAAKEIVRYVYLRTGKLLPIIGDLAAAADGGLIVVGNKGCPAVKALLADADLKKAVEALGPEQYVLKPAAQNGRPVQLVAGGDPVGTLYGAYRLAEHLGVRFYMHGDVVPDARVALSMPQLDEVGRPLFDRRGIQPFHDFPEGPDWWDADGYKAILGQLPKMRMNFFGLHTYPQGGVGPEPLTWIGPPDDVGPNGEVKSSYPSRHFTTGNVTGAWGYRGMKTGDYTFGAAALFDRDDWGADYMKGTELWTKMSPEQCNALFDRMGAVLKDSFTFARRLGIKTCIGTETPLTIPTPVQERLKRAGKNPADLAVIQEVYEGMFQRIVKTHPLDYYWFWTPEGWTWEGTKQQQIDATVADVRAALAAAKKVGVPFTLATCGWVLGPQQDRALFDNLLPKDMPLSCINRMVGHAPVEPGFVDVKGRPKWAIPWMEDDPALISPQLWAGRMRKDAADSLRFGCTGLMGIHWRTRILAPNVSALAKAAWDQKGWNPALSEPGKPQPPQPKQPEGPIGGQVAAFPGNPIAGTDDAPLYQTFRYNTAGYRLDVPSGSYTVTLKLCEPHYKEKGKRVFGAKVQGRPVFDRLDIFEKVGQNKALDYTIKDVKVTDGQVKIDFTFEVEFPSIAAIVVEGEKATRKINCGGPAYKDFQADWPASTGTGAGPDRFLPVADFYADWARAEFGPEAAGSIAELFTKIDGRLPRPSDWVDGPGGIKPDARPWDQVAKDYAFVDDLSLLGRAVNGPGNRERFHYWLAQVRSMRANAQVNCTWARLIAAVAKAKAAKTPEEQKRIARDEALPIRKELIKQVANVHFYLLDSITTAGGMGNVTNWQQHVMPMLLGPTGEELARLLGEALPADALPSKEHAGRPRLFVPVIRTGLVAGEPLRITAVVLGGKPTEAAVYWRPLGSGEFAAVPLGHVARGVYAATLPAEATTADLEYYVSVVVNEGKKLAFPPTAPVLNQTVVIVPEK